MVTVEEDAVEVVEVVEGVQVDLLTHQNHLTHRSVTSNKGMVKETTNGSTSPDHWGEHLQELLEHLGQGNVGNPPPFMHTEAQYLVLIGVVYL